MKEAGTTTSRHLKTDEILQKPRSSAQRSMQCPRFSFSPSFRVFFLISWTMDLKTALTCQSAYTDVSKNGTPHRSRSCSPSALDTFCLIDCHFSSHGVQAENWASLRQRRVPLGIGNCVFDGAEAFQSRGCSTMLAVGLQGGFVRERAVHSALFAGELHYVRVLHGSR